VRTNSGTTVTINTPHDEEDNTVSIVLPKAAFEIRSNDKTPAPLHMRRNDGSKY
jgi:hypothetical protein